MPTSIPLSFCHAPACRRSGLIQIVDANFADAARRGGPHLACRIGCTQCCHGAFRINALDALRLQSGMAVLRASEPKTAEAIRNAPVHGLPSMGSAFPGDPATGLLGNSEDEKARFDEFANEAPCPALDPATGRCEVYAWRP